MNNLLAQTNINFTPGQDQGNFTHLSTINFGTIISSGITLVLIVAALLFFFMLILGGIKWILSGGDKGQTESARSQVTAALIGLVIVFAAWAIASLIGTLFGVNIFSNQITLPTF